MASTSGAGVTSKAGFRAGNRAETSPRIALLDRDVGSGGGAGIDRRGRGDDVERDVVVRSGNRERVRADLVRDVAVRRDPIGAGEHGVDFSRRHSRMPRPRPRSRRTGYPGRRAPKPSGAQPWSSGRVSSTQTCSTRPGLPRGAHGTERRPVSARRERPGVAVRQQPQGRRMPAAHSSRAARPRAAPIGRQRPTSSSWSVRARSTSGRRAARRAPSED